MALASASTSAPAAAGKKSFFKRPAWATQAAPAEPRDFFRHSDAVYDSILREKERRREKHALRKQAKSHPPSGQDDKENKRRRVSTPDEGTYGEDSGSESTEGSERRVAPAADSKNEIKEVVSSDGIAAQPVPSYSSRERTSRTRGASQADKSIIEIDSYSGGPKDLQQRNAQQISRRAPSDSEVSEEEDEYMIELKKKARERARLQKDEKGSAYNQSRAPATATQSQLDPASTSHNLNNEPNGPPEADIPPQPTEKVVQILVTTNIPNAKPLLVNRKVSQPLGRVRDVWCARQNFDEQMAAQILFTWRGKRLYDTSTSTHLLNVLKSERARKLGFPVDDDDDDDDEGEDHRRDPSEGKIEIEAITKDMFEEQQFQKKREEANKEAHGDTDYGLDEQQRAVERSTTPKEPEYKVTMKAQGMEALQLKVRPSTAISKAMVAFRKMRQVDLNKTCWLVFDGDRLEPDSKIGDTEIEDGDSLEVHIR